MQMDSIVKFFSSFCTLVQMDSIVKFLIVDL